MSKASKLGISIMATLLLVATTFLGPMGGFAGYVNEEPFNTADYSSTRIYRKLIFEDVGGIDADIWVNPQNVQVKVDSEFSEPRLSASPNFAGRMYGGLVFYEATSVTIWVQSEEQKYKWEQYIELSRADRMLGINVEEFISIEFASENEEYKYFQEAYEEALEIFYSAGSFLQIKEPVLGFVQIEEVGMSGSPTAAIYEPELNMIILNTTELEALRNYSEPTLWSLFLHELGHAWFEQSTENIQNTYYDLVLSENQASPYLLTRAILNLETIDKENPSDSHKSFLNRAVNEDFAESFSYYFLTPDEFFVLLSERFAFFCEFVSDFAPNCASALAK